MASSAPQQGSVNPLTGKDPAKALTAVASGFFDNLPFRESEVRIHDLEEDTSVLKKESDSLTDRMSKIKSELLNQASIDSTGVFASRLRLVFGDE
ncbi:unnamed protein product [Eruca vesicaria subsp. sativa]|uniref:Uncharacterized protein n=1 Tax=Eruca vesicaria subsp. sativa TaxID=29727 RepID=A0ABC8JLJ5_ERUVS|nr:unnamed protein product [Eruca vesicaria subsp. sativa]